LAASFQNFVNDPYNQSIIITQANRLLIAYGLSLAKDSLLIVPYKYNADTLIPLDVSAVSEAFTKIYSNNLTVFHARRMYVFMIAKRLNATMEVIAHVSVTCKYPGVVFERNKIADISKLSPSSSKAVGPHKNTLAVHESTPRLFILKSTAINMIKIELPGF
jgi:hypothetical protein